MNSDHVLFEKSSLNLFVSRLLLLRFHLANFDQTLYNALLDEGKKLSWNKEL